MGKVEWSWFRWGGGRTVLLHPVQESSGYLLAALAISVYAYLEFGSEDGF